ncbi:uncharacterized protein LOC130898444 [Diorhabda carinulata]|uniref:uncharacterized protein LOC130898444 n=1 Tax=Diorhabda carinulata TaxID=1163345 RepID=UPI0025A23ED7|nr:uncharacterized protein LOC130898444 [Diorhabda carinulata]XP_057663748.1 uncharacterized protein LOC130898444 [Diorhabda carinulata]XP_057663749.1 uncharacterized protein LOC130898444 [Diorhabda carinulata]
MWRALLPTLLPLLVTAKLDCSRTEYNRCVRIADPLVKEVHLVFPDNLNDIDQVCNTWNRFVDCLKTYTDECFTEQQRKQFNRAVESPIESVHEMCTQPSYQKEYLRYAPCIKGTIVQRLHCGPQYNLLVDQVEQGDIISKSTLCCSHDRFKQCVYRETRRLCDRGMADGPATRFATQIIDKALRFLQEQCVNYIPNSGDCTIHLTDPYADRTDSMVISTSSSEAQPWSTFQDLRPKEDFPSSIGPTKVPFSPSRAPFSSPKFPSTFPWSFSSSPTSPSYSTYSTNDFLGSRTRPGIYGRASWSEGSSALPANTVQMFPDVSSTKSTRPDWGSSLAWSTRQGSTSPSTISTTRRNFSPSWSTQEVTSETWYPAAGNQISNEVDEPNQLGLQKPKNSVNKLYPLALVLLIFISSSIHLV